MKRINKLETRTHSFALACENKTQYKTERDALEGADQRMSEHLRLNLSVYQCTTCQLWHLTRGSVDDSMHQVNITQSTR